jgi:hypothetical protein
MGDLDRSGVTESRRGSVEKSPSATLRKAAASEKPSQAQQHARP